MSFTQVLPKKDIICFISMLIANSLKENPVRHYHDLGTAFAGHYLAFTIEVLAWQ